MFSLIHEKSNSIVLSNIQEGYWLMLIEVSFGLKNPSGEVPAMGSIFSKQGQFLFTNILLSWIDQLSFPLHNCNRLLCIVEAFVTSLSPPVSSTCSFQRFPWSSQSHELYHWDLATRPWQYVWVEWHNFGECLPTTLSPVIDSNLVYHYPQHFPFL